MKNKLSYLHYIIYGCIAVLLIVPLYVADSMYFPYITGKNLLFRGVTLIATASFLVLWFKDRSYKPTWSLVSIGILFWIVWMLIADIVGVSPSRSIWGNFERMEGWVTLLHLGLLFISLSSVLRTKIEWKRLFNTALVVSLIPIIHATVEYFSGIGRADAAFGNSTYLGGYALLHAFITLIMLRWWREDHKKESLRKAGLVWGYVLFFILQVWAVYITGTRGSFLGLIGGIGITLLILAFLGKTFPRLRKVSITLLVLMILGAVGFFALRPTPLIQNNDFLARIANIDLAEGTAKGRIVLWGIALDGFKERPITGWGQENFIQTFSKHYDPQMYDQEPWFDRTHNVILDWLVTGGIIGLLAYLFLYIGALIVISRSKVSLPEKALFGGLFTAYFIHNFFVFDNITSYILFIFILSYIHTRSFENESVQKTVPFIKDDLMRNMASGVVLIGMIAAFIVFVTPFASRGVTLINSLYAFRSSPESALSYFTKATSGKGIGFKEEVTTQLAQNTLSVLQDQAVPLEVKQEYVQMSYKHLSTLTSREPKNPRPYLFVGVLAQAIGEKEQTILAFREAVDISPNKQSILFAYAGALLDQGKTSEAVEVYKHAYELAPTYNEARYRYAAALIRNGNTEAGEDLLNIESMGGEVSSMVIQAYYETKQYEKVFTLLRDALEKDSTNIQLWISLAAAYNEAGQTVRAIETLEEAVEANPSFASEAEALKKQITQ